MAKVIEELGGLRSSNKYQFVVDGNKPVQISKYAIVQNNEEDYIEYYVDRVV